MSCTLHHPFIAVVVGPMGCGKTKWVLRLVDNARDVTEPPPERIWYCDGEYQPIFSEYQHVNFQEGLPDMSHGCCPTLLIIDDLISETNQIVANIFRKISHHRNSSMLYLTQNLFDKNRFARTISLNAHYYVLFKKPRDAIQFATLARQMYTNDSRFAVEAYRDATSVPYGYLLIDLKPEQDDRYALRTNIFPGDDTQFVYVKK